MRFTTLAFLFTVDAAVSASLFHQGALNKRQDIDLAAIAANITKGLEELKKAGLGKVEDPPGASARRIETVSQFKAPGAKRVKIRYGPYMVPNMAKKFPDDAHAGMLENYLDLDVEKPCSDSCTLLRQEAGLEYANGAIANVDTGIWFHHMMHFNSGPGRWDPTGYPWLCIPHIGIADSATTSERLFTAGNERTSFVYNTASDPNSGSGYHVRKSDKFKFVVDVMNMNMEDKLVYLTMTYDFIDGPLPTGWKEIKPVWLDANQCRDSEVRPFQENGSFTITSYPWQPNFEGRLVSVVGHLHDGGAYMDLIPGNNTRLCRTNANYAETSAFVYRGADMGDHKFAKNHISSMSGCTPAEIGANFRLRKNQNWVVHGNYDFSLYEGNLERGKQEKVMSNCFLMVEVPPGFVPKPPR